LLASQEARSEGRRPAITTAALLIQCGGLVVDGAVWDVAEPLVDSDAELELLLGRFCFFPLVATAEVSAQAPVLAAGALESGDVAVDGDCRDWGIVPGV
jgi:hypothetical protein